MSKYIPQILIGIVTGIVLYFLVGWLDGFGFLAIWIGFFGGAGTAYILANLAGNRKVALASGADKAKALEFVPPPGQALLVVQRRGYIAKLAGLNLFLDEREFAQLKSPAFTCLAVTPGAHTLAVRFGGLAGPQSKPGTWDFQAPDGGVVGVRIDVGLGLAQNAFKFTPESDVAQLRAQVSPIPMVVATPAA